MTALLVSLLLGGCGKSTDTDVDENQTTDRTADGTDTDTEADTDITAPAMISPKDAMTLIGEVRCEAADACGGSSYGNFCVPCSSRVGNQGVDVDQALAEACVAELRAAMDIDACAMTLNPLPAACDALYQAMELPMSLGHYFMTFDAEYRIAATECDPDFEVEVEDCISEDCTFDPVAAQDCLDAVPWECVPSQTPYVDLPRVCLNVFDCDAGGDTGGGTVPTGP